jgi:hypothetical protein
MEAIWTMNIFSDLFGIFRQRGLVETIKEDGRLTGFTISAILLAIFGAALYGFAMGIGVGIETAIKDAMKLGLMAALGLLFAVPVFWVAYRLLGQQQRATQVLAIPLTLLATVAMVLLVTAPIVFMLSILTGNSPYAVYIHVVIINLALLVGIYLAGTLIYHGFSDHRGLVIPNVVGFLMLGVILVVLMSFLGPFLEPSRTFSVGTDRLSAGLGIGVSETVDQALAAATEADRVTYSYQTTNENGDLVRNYVVTRVGNDFLVEIMAHAVPGEPVRSNVRIWEIDGECYVDFDDGRVMRVDRSDIATIVEPALPPEVYKLPAELDEASWRAFESGGRYTVTGTGLGEQQAKLVLSADSRRLSELVIGSATRGVHSERRVLDIQAATVDSAGLEAGLNQATIAGSVDRSDASMDDFIQTEKLFVVRYPRTWRVGTWSSSQQRIEFKGQTRTAEDEPVLIVSVYDLQEDKGPRQYADDLARSLELQAEYRDVSADVSTIGEEVVGVVEYLHDRTVKGEIETTRHYEVVYSGQLYRYHLDFSADLDSFDEHEDLFQDMAEEFTYLRADLWEQGS